MTEREKCIEAIAEAIYDDPPATFVQYAPAEAAFIRSLEESTR